MLYNLLEDGNPVEGAFVYSKIGNHIIFITEMQEYYFLYTENPELFEIGEMEELFHLTSIDKAPETVQNLLIESLKEENP